LLGQIHENCPELFDQKLTEFSEEGHRFILCRHHQKGYRREAQNHANLRKAYEALKAVKVSPQNTNKEKLYHRAMKALEKYNQTKCWTLSFNSSTDKKGKVGYQLAFSLDRRQFKAQNTIGHYYLLQTDLSPKELTTQEASEYYKNLIKAERCFRSLKSDMEIRPIRHRKENRIRGHIYLNFLALWLVKCIEKKWRSRAIKCEVPGKLKEWDDRMRLHEIYDKENNELLDLQWNQGPIASQTFEEVQRYGEMERRLPHM
jgi:transposase